MLSEELKEALPERIYQRLNKVNQSTLTKIGERVGKIGRLSASDRQKLEQLKVFGGDIDAITAELAAASQKNIADIYEIYEAAAKENYKFAEQFYKAAGVKYIPFAENKVLQDFVKAQAKITQGDYINMSRTTAFLDKNKQLTSLAKTYQNVIDEAVTAVSMGVADYQSAMRGTIKQLADSGMRTKYTPLKNAAGKAVDYPTGYSRRLDTSARQNILWGIKAINQEVADMTGEEFSADGYEIDYHSCPRPSHEAMGGQQYAIGRGRTVNGIYYPSFDSVFGLLQEYGCLHFKFSILLGISPPAYDKGELERLKAADMKTIEYEGKEYTKYEATQVQRKLETAARNAKDRQIIAKACGDDTLMRQEQEKINAIAYKYNDFSKAASLPTKMERMRVAGYHKVLTNSEKSGIIISSPINKRNTAKGNPNAILHFNRPLNNRQTQLLDNLPSYDSRVTVNKKQVKMTDLSALTAKTGDEFAMFTKGGSRLIIRGNYKSVNINTIMAKKLAEDGYKWSGHTHPGTDEIVLQASKGDLKILSCFKQKQSVVYNSKGLYKQF